MAPVAAGPLNGGNTTASSVMLDRAENLLHKNFGQYQFWSARRSMRFSPELRKFANEYRAKHFNSGKNIFKIDPLFDHFDNGSILTKSLRVENLTSR